jgi:hypothetical protein
MEDGWLHDSTRLTKAALIDTTTPAIRPARTATRS